MKNTLRTYLLSGFLGIAVALVSCKKEEEPSYNPAVPITIESFIPAQGGGGTEILINGSNFSTDTSQLSVTLNGHPLKIIGTNGHQLMAVVPQKVGSGPLVVKIGDKSAESATAFNYVYTHTVSTLAGSGTVGYVNGKGTDASFNFADYRCGLTVDDNLNVYVADAGNHCIRKITPDGTVSTLAGNPNNAGYADGKGSAANFQWPFDVSVDAAGNVYSVDPWNWDIRKITPDGTATTIGWSIGSGPFCVGVDKLNGNVYYTAHDAGKINRITPDGTNTTIIEGLAWPSDIAVDDQHNLMIVLHDAAMIAKYTVDTWERTILAGQDGVYGYQNGAGTAALFSSPWSIAIDGNNNLYIAGNGSWDGSSSNPDQSIRLIEANTGNVSTLAGSSTAGYADAIGPAAAFSAPTGVAVDKNGTVYVLDRKNSRIRKIVTE
jgi:hypothetical protein